MGLLTRLLDPKPGQVLLDGVDLRDYRLADLRNQFAHRPTGARAVLDHRRGEHRLRPARCQPKRGRGGGHGGATPMTSSSSCLTAMTRRSGERGMRLSGGERQRISLARAFLKDAPVLILDEPTSSVDVRTEQLILDAVERLTTGRTSFMISHRPGDLGLVRHRPRDRRRPRDGHDRVDAAVDSRRKRTGAAHPRGLGMSAGCARVGRRRPGRLPLRHPTTRRSRPCAPRALAGCSNVSLDGAATQRARHRRPRQNCSSYSSCRRRRRRRRRRFRPPSREAPPLTRADGPSGRHRLACPREDVDGPAAEDQRGEVSSISRDGVKHQPNTDPSRISRARTQDGGPRGDRTHNPRIKSPLLCQLS